MTRIEFAIAALLVGALAVFLTAAFAILYSRASRRHKLAVNTQSQTPQIRDALVAYLSGSNDQARIREFSRTNRSDLADAILEFHGAVGGSARDRLCDLALELSLVQDWCREAHSKELSVRRRAYFRLSFVCAYEPCRRLAGELLLAALNDDDPEIRLAAARALVESGTIDELGQVFGLAVSQSLLFRLLLAGNLRRHSTELCGQVVPAILGGENISQILAALQILVAWERALPLNNLHRLLESSNHDVRLAAIRLAPLIPLTPESKRNLLQLLHQGDTDENTAAALAAGRLRLQEALASLARCVRTGTAELARIAAAAMAEMPPKGWETLQQIAAGSDSSAVIAAAALERGGKGMGV